MKQRVHKFWIVVSLAIPYIVAPLPIVAQIIPDATLKVNSSVTNSGNTSVITNGTTAGGNLFHSFSSFSVPTGNTAYFNNAINIQNIITRVTGSSISNIDGTLRANGSANLFLINPNGIIFGPNASLNIGGSFLASSASSIKFADGSSFDATNPSSPPLLTVSVPIGLQFGPNPGRIVVQGTGNNLSFDPDTDATITDNRPVGLQVSEGQTLALIGGEVALEGGNITAPSGRIELGSVGALSSIRLNSPDSGIGWILGYSLVDNFSNIRLSNAASADASGNGSGNIQVRSRNLILSDGSAILALNEGSNSGGKVEVNATDSVEIVGTTADSKYISTIVVDVQPEATGNGGDLTIETGRLIIRDGANISSNTFGAGRAGNLTVRASNSVEAIGISADGQYVSGLFTDAREGTGDGGDLTIETGRLILRDGAQIGSGTFSAGNGGTLTVRASDSVEAIGTSADSQYPSGLFVDAPKGTGDGGDLTIETGRLIIRDGAKISSNTFSAGRAGNLTVRASNSIEAIGTSANGEYVSGLFADAQEGTGDGGDLTIETGRLILRDGAQIGSGTFTAGNGGTLTVRASDSVEAIGSSADGQYPSGLFVDAPKGTGDGGDLTIETGRLILRNGAQISSNTFSVGRAGNLTIRASDSVEAIGESADGLYSSGLLANAAAGTGNGGDLTIETGRLILRNGGFISSSTFSAGRGGTLTVRASDSVEALGTSADGQYPSGLLASAEAGSAGDGGDLTIETGRAIVRDGAQINVSSQGTGLAGNLLINAGSLRLDNRGVMTAATGVGGGNITVNSRDIQLRRTSNINTNATGTSAGGNITLNTATLAALENSDITANSEESFGGRVVINAQGIFGTEFRSSTSDLTSDITASSALGASFSGTVEINTPDVAPTSALLTLPSGLVDVSRLIASECEAFARGSSFTVTGKGGLPPNPHEPLVGSAVVVDWATLEGRSETGVVRREEYPISNSQYQIVEATGWVMNDKGQVVLIANASLGSSDGNWYRSPRCQGMR